VNSRLIENDMRELGQIVSSVLDPATSDDTLRTTLIRFPESGFVDVVSFLEHSLTEAVGLEHFDAADLKAICLTESQSLGFLLDEASGDVGEE